LPVVSPACSSFFHIVQVQFKISLEEMPYIFRCLGAGRPPLWRSPAWELQVVRRQLCTSTVISDHRTASAFPAADIQKNFNEKLKLAGAVNSVPAA
jgi:hypothetical protein